MRLTQNTAMPTKLVKISKDDYETLAALRYSLRLFLHFSEEAAETAGVAPQQHQALLAIKGFPGRDHVTIGELAERLQIRHHSAVGLVNRLVANGFITRRQADEDRRQVHLALTQRGESVLAKLSAIHKQQLQRMGPEIENLLGILRGRKAR
jgi:DNA-binding MarR family transcriptional regulator